ncbi:MAG: DUF4230 domain-containing protein [Capnocytophaga sp.]|nr:DUF4230 domain-containing protein [Capnocytophaga sp.]
MRNFLIGILAALVLFLAYQFFTNKKNEQETIEANSALIQTQINNVGKLVVTEGHFSEIISYKDSKKYLLDMVSFDKNILVVVNADVTVAYDLHKIRYELDETTKTVRITFLPEAEVKIYPNLKYYDIGQSQMNPFRADDVDKIRKKIDVELQKRIEASNLKTNASNRLLSELSNLLLLTKSLGWTLEYNGNVITTNADWNIKN